MLMTLAIISIGLTIEVTDESPFIHLLQIFFLGCVVNHKIVKAGFYRDEYERCTWEKRLLFPRLNKQYSITRGNILFQKVLIFSTIVATAIILNKYDINFRLFIVFIYSIFNFTLLIICLLMKR